MDEIGKLELTQEEQDALRQHNREYKRKWQRDNWDKVKAYQRRWRDAHPEKAQEYKKRQAQRLLAQQRAAEVPDRQPQEVDDANE